MSEPEQPDAEYMMLVDNRPDGKAVPFLRQTYHLGDVPDERDVDVMTGERYKVLGTVTSGTLWTGAALTWPAWVTPR